METTPESLESLYNEEEWLSYCDKYGYDPDSVCLSNGDGEVLSQDLEEESWDDDGPDDNSLSRRSSRWQTPEEVLEHYWGFSRFRPKQREIIDSILEGRDTLGLLPTGEGRALLSKSPVLCYEG